MVVRVNKTNDYTTMSNIHLKDRRLSLKAKGLLSVVLSLPPDWKYSIEGLAAISKEKETSIKSALDELKDNGYFLITKKMPNETKSGRIEYEWDFYERPHIEAEQPKQEVKKQGIENLPLEILSLENQGQLNTNISNTDVLNTKELDISPISPLENRKLLFKQFWDAYPPHERKVNYDGCEKLFVKIKNLEQIFPDIMASLEMWKIRWSKDDFKYVPTTHKWINQKYWLVTDTRTEKQALADEAAADFITNMFGGT